MMAILFAMNGFKHKREMIVSIFSGKYVFGDSLFILQELDSSRAVVLEFNGMYYGVSQDEERYALSIQKPYWFIFGKTGIHTHSFRGETGFCFTSIFAPTNLKDSTCMATL